MRWLLTLIAMFGVGISHALSAEPHLSNDSESLVSTEGFQPMTKEQAAEVALYQLANANRSLKGLNGAGYIENCDAGKLRVTTSSLRGVSEETTSICALSDAELKKIIEQVPSSSISRKEKQSFDSDGKKKKVTWSISMGNDASPTKFQTGTEILSDSFPGEGLNDDVGRTFDVGASRRTEDTEGNYSEMKAESTSFGRRTTVDGAQKDAEGRPYYQLLNVTSLTFAKGTRLSSSGISGTTDLQVVEGSIEISTGSTKSPLGTELQRWFHNTTQSGPIYHYVQDDKLRIVAVLKGGMTRIIEGDLGAFHCKVSGTGLVGLRSDAKPVLEGRISAAVSTGTLGGRAKDNPWIQLLIYRNHLIIQGQRLEEEYGVKISTSVKVGGVTIQPYIGVAKFDGKDDRSYSIGSRGGREPYYTFGLSSQF